MKKRIPYDYLLYFKIENAPIITNLEVLYKEPEGIRVSDLKFDIYDQSRFYIKLLIQKKPLGYYKDLYISAVLNKNEKKISVYPKIIHKTVNRLKDLLDFPKYKYNESTNLFSETTETEKESIYITPFNYYFPFVYNLYPLENYRGYKVEPKYESNYDFFLLCYSEEASKLMKIKYKDKNKYNDIIEIIGIFKDDKWYPISMMENYKNDIFISFQGLEYKEEEIVKAKDILNKIKTKNDYWFIPSIIKNSTNKKDIFIQLLNYLPSSIKNDLSEESKILNGDANNLIDKYFPIIENNFIFVLFKHFKNKYLEIKKNNGIIYLENVKPPDNILNIIEEKRKDYFQINQDAFMNNVFFYCKKIKIL